jgi:putative transposase
MTYKPKADPQAVALRQRLKELAATRVRYGYRRLTVLLRRSGWKVNHKRIYRLYKQEGLELRYKRQKKRAAQIRVPLPGASRRNERWSMDFVTDRLEDGRSFRILTVVDQYSRECVALAPSLKMSGEKVAECLSQVGQQRGLPQAITVDNGSEFYSRAMDRWAYERGVQLDFIRPGRPVENGYIESFNGKLRDECLNVHLFFSITDAKQKLEAWARDYNQERPHSALAQLSPRAFVRAQGDGAEQKAEKWGVISNDLNNPDGLFTTGPARADRFGETVSPAPVDVAGITPKGKKTTTNTPVVTTIF